MKVINGNGKNTIKINLISTLYVSNNTVGQCSILQYSIVQYSIVKVDIILNEVYSECKNKQLLHRNIEINVINPVKRLQFLNAQSKFHSLLNSMNSIIFTCTSCSNYVEICILVLQILAGESQGGMLGFNIASFFCILQQKL